MSFQNAIVCKVPNSYFKALSQSPGQAPIDVAKAQKQHLAYVEAFKDCGISLTVCEADEALPDCCFVEDCALFTNELVFVCRPAEPSRQPEIKAMSQVLSLLPFSIQHIEAPATVEGGDCMLAGNTLFIGRSNRTNAMGIEQIKARVQPFGIDVVTVEVSNQLHLKCVCTYLGNDRILVAENAIPTSVFSRFKAIVIPENEAYAANCVAVGNTVLIAQGFPATKSILRQSGFTTIELDVSEFAKANGSLSCLSLRY